MGSIAETSRNLLSTVNKQCSNFYPTLKEIGKELNVNDKLHQDLNPDRIVSSLNKQIDSFLSASKSQFDWDVITVHPDNCQMITAQVLEANQANDVAQKYLLLTADLACKTPDEFRDVCLDFRMPEQSEAGFSCTLSKGCATNPTLSPAQPPSFAVPTNGPDANQAAGDGAIEDSATTTQVQQQPLAADAETASQAGPQTAEVFTAAPALHADAVIPQTTLDSTPTTASTAAPADAAVGATPVAAADAQTGAPSSSASAGAPTSTSSLPDLGNLGLAKVGAGSCATVFFTYKAFKEAKEWYRATYCKKEADLQAPRQRSFERVKTDESKTEKNTNPGQRALAYSAAAAASLAFTVFSL